MFIEIFNDDDLNQKFNHMKMCTLTLEQTLDLVIEKNLSIARYGDGEIRMVNSLRGCMFESSTYYGTSKLRTILYENHKNLLVCIPGGMSGGWWGEFWKKEFNIFSKFISTKIYGHSFISRTVFSRLGQPGVEKWKSVWNDRKVVFVTGEGGRFNCNHILFNNTKSSELFSSKAKHAIKDIPRIISELSTKDQDTLFLLALGPAATILAYELTLLGFQAIDIGHITNCYDAVFHGTGSPEKLPVKK